MTDIERIKAEIERLRAENEAFAKEQAAAAAHRAAVKARISNGNSKNAPLTDEERQDMMLRIQLLNAQAEHEDLKRTKRGKVRWF